MSRTTDLPTILPGATRNSTSPERSAHLYGYAHRVRQLRRLQRGPPARISCEALLRHHYHIARPHICAFCAAAKQPATSAHHRSIRADYKNRFLVGDVRGSTRPLQIPARTASRFVRNRRRVVDLTAHHHGIRPFRYIKHVFGANLYISGTVHPVFHVCRDVNYLPPGRRRILKFLQGILPLNQCGLFGNFLLRFNFRYQFQAGALGLKLIDQVGATFRLQLLDLRSLEYGSVGIRVVPEPAGTFNDGTQAFAVANSIHTWMYHLTPDLNSCSNVLPSGQFSNSQHIPIAETHICISVARHGLRNRNTDVFSFDLLATFHRVARKIRRIRKGTTFEASSQPDQISGIHFPPEGIFAWKKHWSGNDNCRWIGLAQVTLNE